MSFSRKFFVAAVAAILALAVNTSFAEGTFRGIAKADALDIPSSVFDTLRGDINFETDVRDNFTGRTGPLAGSEVDGTYADGTRIGFIMPVDIRDANGNFLKGALPSHLLVGDGDPNTPQHGEWMGHEGYSVVDGRVELADVNQPGVACLPWRTPEGLGDFYMLDATANVADGETVSIGYFGDVATVGAATTLADDLGLLVLNLTRTEKTINWEVKWEGDIASSLTGTVPGEFTENEDVNLQLGWLDRRAIGLADLFEAHVNDNQLVLGDMGTAVGFNGNIDVFGVGFELSGEGSSFDSFAAAVPEPTTGLMGLMGFLAILGLRRRNA